MSLRDQFVIWRNFFSGVMLASPTSSLPTTWRAWSATSVSIPRWSSPTSRRSTECATRCRQGTSALLVWQREFFCRFRFDVLNLVSIFTRHTHFFSTTLEKWSYQNLTGGNQRPLSLESETFFQKKLYKKVYMTIYSFSSIGLMSIL